MTTPDLQAAFEHNEVIQRYGRNRQIDTRVLYESFMAGASHLAEENRRLREHVSAAFDRIERVIKGGDYKTLPLIEDRLRLEKSLEILKAALAEGGK